MSAEQIVLALVALIPTITGFLLNRSIRGVDQSLTALGAKVDALGSQDTQNRIKLAELEVRIAALERKDRELDDH